MYLARELGMITDLEDECDKIFAIAGQNAVDIYLDLIEKRPQLGIDEEANNYAIEYRKKLKAKYKKIKLSK